MDFSDDDVSASGDELECSENDDVELEQADNDETGSDSGDEQMPQAQAAAAAAAAGAAPAAGREAVQAAQEALLSGEISTNAALLQLQVCCCCCKDDAVHVSGLQVAPCAASTAASLCSYIFFSSGPCHVPSGLVCWFLWFAILVVLGVVCCCATSYCSSIQNNVSRAAALYQ
jgi:hypothetical protein